MFIVLPIAQATLARRAIAKLDGLPRRAEVLINGVADPDLTKKLGAALDVTDSLDVGVNDGTLACIELPPSLEHFAGRTVAVEGETITLPTIAEMIAREDDLPPTLRALRQAKRQAP